jgi:NADH dehydrogenase [ubiquinone] 1 alpha subcomplex assembly factor 5
MSSAPPHLSDMQALTAHRNRAAAGFAEFSFLKQLGVDRLVERLSLVKRSFADILDIGCHAGEMVSALSDSAIYHHNMRFTQIELAQNFADIASRNNAHTLCSGMMPLPVGPAQFDAITSAMFLHWIDDLPGLLTQARLALRPDGFFVANMLGGRSLQELRQVLVAAESELFGGMSPRTLPMADIRDLGGVMQRAGFSLPVIDAELVTVTYPDMFRLMADLRGMGEQNALVARSRTFTSKALFMRAAEIYRDEFGTEDGQIGASFELITLTGWSPAPSQPQPLAPGSATRRLADAVDSTEIDPLADQNS